MRVTQQSNDWIVGPYMIMGLKYIFLICSVFGVGLVFVEQWDSSLIDL
jgi:hypothetical protein